MHEKRDDPDPSRIGKKYQIPVIEREVTFTLDDGTINVMLSKLC
ncbi:hypothetical protein ES705_30627 [subsurface metagenome]